MGYSNITHTKSRERKLSIKDGWSLKLNTSWFYIGSYDQLEILLKLGQLCEVVVIDSGIYVIFIFFVFIFKLQVFNVRLATFGKNLKHKKCQKTTYNKNI